MLLFTNKHSSTHTSVVVNACSLEVQEQMRFILVLNSPFELLQEPMTRGLLSHVKQIHLSFFYVH